MECLEELKKIGVKQIQKKTHIAKSSIEAIVNQDYDNIHKVHFYGFTTIFENTYGIKLDELKEDYEAYLEQKEQQKPHKEIFLTPPRQAKGTWKKVTVLSLFLAALLGAIYYKTYILDANQAISLDSEKTIYEENLAPEEELPKEAVIIEEETETLTEEPSQEPTEKPVEIITTDAQEEKKQKETTTQEKTLNEVDLTKTQAVEEKPLVASIDNNETIQKQSEEKDLGNFFVRPKSKIWIGVIELETGKKRQALTTEGYSFDASKDQLIIFGHGHFNLKYNGTEFNLSDPNRVRFIFENNELNQTTKEKFRARNKGKDW